MPIPLVIVLFPGNLTIAYLALSIVSDGISERGYNQSVMEKITV